MTRQRILALLAVGAVLVPATALAATTPPTPPGPPDEVLELARGAAGEARGLALGLTQDIAELGTPRGRGSDAFVARRELLAALHAEHPGNAAAVHGALLDRWSSPSSAGAPTGDGQLPPGQAKKRDAEALRGARARFAEGWPGRGLGRGNGAGGAED